MTGLVCSILQEFVLRFGWLRLCNSKCNMAEDCKHSRTEHEIRGQLTEEGYYVGIQIIEALMRTISSIPQRVWLRAAVEIQHPDAGIGLMVSGIRVQGLGSLGFSV